MGECGFSVPTRMTTSFEQAMMTSTVYSGQGVFKEGSHLAIFLSHGNKTEGGGPLLGYK